MSSANLKQFTSTSNQTVADAELACSACWVFCLCFKDEARRHLEDLDTQCVGCSVWISRLQAREKKAVLGSDMAHVALEARDPGKLTRI